MLSKKGSFFEVGKNTINVFNTKVDVLYILWFLFIIFLVMSYIFLYCQFKFFDFMTHKYTKHEHKVLQHLYFSDHTKII